MLVFNERREKERRERERGERRERERGKKREREGGKEERGGTRERKAFLRMFIQ